jgi:hypothetical protein
MYHQRISRTFVHPFPLPYVTMAAISKGVELCFEDFARQVWNKLSGLLKM